MKKRRFNPPLDKRLVGNFDSYKVYSVDAFAVRNAAEPDEEFDNFATNGEFPDLVPDGEIWVSNRSLRSEGRFFIANAVARLNALKAGASEATAYTMGLNADRKLRARETGLEYRSGRRHKRIPPAIYHRRYLVLPDPQFPIEVWLIDGSLARTYYKTDYTEGGHGYVYRWVPHNEIWIEKDLHKDEFPFMVAHEYTELRLMRDKGIEYDRAHDISSRVEYHLRKRDYRKDFPGLSARKLTRADLPKLTRPEYFEYVLDNYVHNMASRISKLISDAKEALLP
jgi:hypothetical protein